MIFLSSAAVTTMTADQSAPTLSWWQRLQPHLAPIAVVLLAAAIGQLVTLTQASLALQLADSTTYTALALNHHWFDAIRTPGYPLLLGIIFALHGGGLHLSAVVFAQAFLLVLATTEIYVLVYNLSRQHWLAAFIAALVGVNLYILQWERLIMTEALSIWLVVTFFLIVERYIRRNGSVTLLLLVITSVALILTRPFYLYMPLLTCALIAARAIRRRQLRLYWRQIAIVIVAIYGCIVGYATLNQISNAYFGLSCVSSVNLFGKVLQYGLQNAPTDPRFAQLRTDANTFIHLGSKSANPFVFMAQFPGRNYSAQCYKPLSDFAIAAITAKPLNYTLKTVPYVNKSWLDAPYLYAPFKVNVAVTILGILSLAGLGVYLIYPLILIGTVWRGWQRPQENNTFFCLVLVANIFGGLVVTAADSYAEYPRMRSPFDWAFIVLGYLAIAQLAVNLRQLRAVRAKMTLSALILGLPTVTATNPSLESNVASKTVPPITRKRAP